MQRWYAPGSGVFLISALQIGITFLLTLTKNRLIKWNFIKNILQAALIHGGYCLGHGLGLHLLLRQFRLPPFPDSIGHKSSLPVSPAASSQRHRPAPETVFLQNHLRCLRLQQHHIFNAILAIQRILCFITIHLSRRMDDLGIIVLLYHIFCVILQPK